jgi:hypothetical protein
VSSFLSMRVRVLFLPCCARPLDLDSLSIIDLELFGMPLCWLWLSRVDNSRPWSDMPVSEDPCTSAFFDNSVSVEVGDGKSSLF